MESTETQIKTIETQIKKGRGRPPLSEEEKQRRLANKNPKGRPRKHDLPDDEKKLEKYEKNKIKARERYKHVEVKTKTPCRLTDEERADHLIEQKIKSRERYRLKREAAGFTVKKTV